MESRISKPGFNFTLGPIVREILRVKVDASVDEIPFSGGYISGLARATHLKFDKQIERSPGFPNLVSNLL